MVAVTTEVTHHSPSQRSRSRLPSSSQLSNFVNRPRPGWMPRPLVKPAAGRRPLRLCTTHHDSPPAAADTRNGQFSNGGGRRRRCWVGVTSAAHSTQRSASGRRHSAIGPRPPPHAGTQAPTADTPDALRSALVLTDPATVGGTATVVIGVQPRNAVFRCSALPLQYRGRGCYRWFEGTPWSVADRAASARMV